MSSEHCAGVVSGASPWIERATLELRHVPWLAGVDGLVVLVVIERYWPPYGRMRAIEALRVRVLETRAQQNISGSHEDPYETIDVHRAGPINKVATLSWIIVCSEIRLSPTLRADEHRTHKGTTIPLDL